MSVQAGIWNFEGKPIDHALISGFQASLKQQGPDGESCWSDNSIALLYRPFHTTAESRREKQPHTSRRGFVLTWDGRLDNREDLIAEFRGYLDAQPTDVDIVAAAFDHWETACFRHIIGDFAVTIWRPKERELVFAADYMAIRHIFYYLKELSIWWSTDLAPVVLLSGDRFHIDDDYIAGYFAHDPDAHLTPYREIREVPPGHFVRVRAGSVQVERYWRFSPKSRIRYRTDAEYEEHFRHVFRQGVRRRLRSDAPILAELSGGLDSSSIVCMADSILAKEGAEAPRIDTLSYYDKTEPSGDDWIYFQKVEEKRGRSGAHIDASQSGSSPVALDYKEFNPLPGFLAYGRELEGKRAAVVRGGGYRAVLSGLGGDEFLGGIPNPSAQLGDLIVQFQVIKLAQQLLAWSLVKRRPWLHLLYDAITDLLAPSLRQYFVAHATVEPWIDRKFAKRARITVRRLDVEEHFGMWLPTRRSSIGGVVLMAAKLSKWKSPTLAPEEYRYPYLDQVLIEYTLSIPANQLLRPGNRRSLMRRALEGLVPPDVLRRKTKQIGARTPAIGLEMALSEIETAFNSPLSSRLKYVNPLSFLDKLHTASNGKDMALVPMLKTISLEFWLRNLASRGLIAGVNCRPGFAHAGALEAGTLTPAMNSHHSC